MSSQFKIEQKHHIRALNLIKAENPFSVLIQYASRNPFFVSIFLELIVGRASAHNENPFQSSAPIIA